MKDVLLAAYAFTGIGTVSSIYKKGNVSPFKEVEACNILRQKLLGLMTQRPLKMTLLRLASFCFATIYDSTDQFPLNELRYKFLWSRWVLSLTTAVAREHSLRVYHQVQQRHGFTKDPLQ